MLFSSRVRLRRLGNHLLDLAESNPLGCRREVTLGKLLGSFPKVAHHARIESRAQADTLDAGLLELGPRERTAHRTDQDVDRLWGNRLYDRLDRNHIGRIGRIKNVGADFGERDEAFDGVVEIRPALDEVVRAPGQHNPALCRLRRMAYALYSIVKFADRVGRIPAGVLDPDPRQSSRNRRFDCQRDVVRTRSVAVLEITVDW